MKPKREEKTKLSEDREFLELVESVKFTYLLADEFAEKFENARVKVKLGEDEFWHLITRISQVHHIDVNSIEDQIAKLKEEDKKSRQQ